MRVFGIVSYKGTNYQGWAKQPSLRTVQGEIESKLSQVLNEEININGSGRTDAGVHALGQTFTFDVSKEIDLDKLCYSLNRMLDNDIQIINLKTVEDSFHARFSAKRKSYLYKILLASKEPFEKDLQYVFPYDFDFDLFEKACKLFVGKHCFKDFTSKEEDEQGFIRDIKNVLVSKSGNQIDIKFTGNGFMRYQIRDMVGSALAVATKKEPLVYIKKHLENSGNRDIVQYKAPPEGLYLVEVDY